MIFCVYINEFVGRMILFTFTPWTWAVAGWRQVLWKSGIHLVAQAAYSTLNSRSRRSVPRLRLGCVWQPKVGRSNGSIIFRTTTLGDYDTAVAPDPAAVDAIGRDPAFRLARSKTIEDFRKTRYVDYNAVLKFVIYHPQEKWQPMEILKTCRIFF